MIFGVSFHQGELPVRPSALVPPQREKWIGLCVPGGRDVEDSDPERLRFPQNRTDVKVLGELPVRPHGEE